MLFTRVLIVPMLLTVAALPNALSQEKGKEIKQTSDAKARKFVSLFDGKSLEGWQREGGFAKYSVEEKTIVGRTAEGSRNTFLATKRDYANFELRLEVKCEPELNSGIQIRSHTYEKDTPQASNADRLREAGEVYGYQVEISANGNAGRVWDEGRHTRWYDEEPSEETKTAYKPGEWNRYRIVARGDRIRSWINGVPVVDFHDKLDSTGFIGLQVHGIKKGSGPFEVRWRKIRIRELH